MILKNIIKAFPNINKYFKQQQRALIINKLIKHFNLVNIENNN